MQPLLIWRRWTLKGALTVENVMSNSSRLTRSLIVLLSLTFAFVGCKKDAAKEASSTPPAKKVEWDKPGKKGEATPQATDLADEWPIPGPFGAEEFARGGAGKVAEIRQALTQYEGVFLTGWKDVLADENAPADEVQAALTELMNAVTGPAGLWTQLPQKWFGCGDNADSEPCRAFAKTTPHFKKWAA
ncbi:MAG: hypothetical protein ACI9OJ_001041, partial [Myxococcota bacterium]